MRAVDDHTIVFHLLHAASDFLNLLALPFASPVPSEYLDYLPDSAAFRQHTLSVGPYRIARYVAEPRAAARAQPCLDRSHRSDSAGARRAHPHPDRRRCPAAATADRGRHCGHELRRGSAVGGIGVTAGHRRSHGLARAARRGIHRICVPRVEPCRTRSPCDPSAGGDAPRHRARGGPRGGDAGGGRATRDRGH